MVSNRQQEQLKKIGEFIQTARKLREITQDELAIRSGVSRQSVISLENGHSYKIETLLSVLFSLGLDKNLMSAMSFESDEVGIRIARLKVPKSVRRRNKNAT